MHLSNFEQVEIDHLHADRAARLLGVETDLFITNLTKPKLKVRQNFKLED